jgi:large subunit ribosomal protein L31/Ran GTPase-activating protein 1
MTMMPSCFAAPDLLPQTLDLCCNQIMRPGALAVARALAGMAKAGSSKLTLLALDENAISEAGVEQLKALLTVSG